MCYNIGSLFNKVDFGEIGEEIMTPEGFLFTFLSFVVLICVIVVITVASTVSSTVAAIVDDEDDEE